MVSTKKIKEGKTIKVYNKINIKIKNLNYIYQITLKILVHITDFNVQSHLKGTVPNL